MDSVVPDDGLKTKTYMLTGVAEEVFTHKTTIVNKAYKTQLSKVVEDILKNYLKTQKQVFTEPTKGIQEYIVTDKRPFAAIKDILVRSVSERRKSSAYVFFEDHNGFNFCTMEFLFSMDPVARFTNYTSPAYSIIPSNFRNIYGYTLPDTFDTAMKLGRGAFTSTLKYIDLETQNYSTKDVSPDVKSMKRGESPLSSSDRFKQLFSNSGMVQYIPKDMRKPDTYIDEMLPNRAAYAAELDQQRLHIAILGDSTLSVGQKIYVELMNVDGTTGPKRPDPLLAADYIITKLIHIIRPVDAQPRYTQSAELMIAAYKRQV
jgi:hypothetical protein